MGIMENKNSVGNLARATIDSLREAVDSDIIIGDTIKIKDDIYVIPMSKLLLGVSSYGRENPKGGKESFFNKFKSTFGVNSILSIKPIGFLVLKDNSFRVISIDKNDKNNEVIYSLPQLIDTVKGIISEYSLNSDSKDFFDE